MINFDRFTLDNGLRIIVHQDNSTPMVAVNLLYNVGARDEDPAKTGFAHLFEHLMFGGSKNIPNFDNSLQRVGAEYNAFTNNDITNYYITLPKDNIETAFWLESDRMLELDFSQKSLDVQKNVVIEEYKQHYLNQPYGDVWLNLRPLAFKEHPYQWATIGKEISHIEDASLEDVKSFFFKHYAPNNAILVVSGNITSDEVMRLSEKWFAPIERRDVPQRNLPVEPEQTEARHAVYERDEPYTAIYKAYHMCSRMHADYCISDMVSDLLSLGKSSRFNQRLIEEKKLFTSIDGHITGDADNGLFIVNGHLVKGITVEQAEEAIAIELNLIKDELVGEYELNKAKNKVETMMQFSEISILNKAMNLAYAELMGDANLVNLEIEKYRAITSQDIQRVARQIFRDENCSTMLYRSNK